MGQARIAKLQPQPRRRFPDRILAVIQARLFAQLTRALLVWEAELLRGLKRTGTWLNIRQRKHKKLTEKNCLSSVR